MKQSKREYPLSFTYLSSYIYLLNLGIMHNTKPLFENASNKKFTVNVSFKAVIANTIFSILSIYGYLYENVQFHCIQCLYQEGTR